MATHHRASLAVAPVIQAIAAFPAPTYFPLIFIATLPVVSAALPYSYTEIYVFILGFLSCFYYVFFDFWIGVQAIPLQFWEVMRNNELGLVTRMRRIILPGTFPYLITGISSTINSAWAGIAIGEYWPNIFGNHSLEVEHGMMKYISINMANGQVASAAVGFIPIRNCGSNLRNSVHTKSHGPSAKEVRSRGRCLRSLSCAIGHL